MVVLPTHHLAPFRFAILAPLGLILEALVCEEELLPGSENEIRTAVHTLQNPVPVLHRRTPPLEQGPTHYAHSTSRHREASVILAFRCLWILILFVSGFFACPLASQGGLDSLLLTRFQVERMSLDFFYDVFLLDFPLEAAQRVF